MKILLTFALLAALAGTAKADTVWQYQGNSINYGGMFYNPGPNGGPVPIGDIQPNPCNCALTGSVTLDASGNPVAWNFTAAGDNWTSANSTGSINPVLTIGAPVVPFVLWGIELTNNLGETMFSQFGTFSMLDAYDFSSNGLIVQGDPGTWTDPVSTPEPGTFSLLGVGLALAALCGKYLL